MTKREEIDELKRRIETLERIIFEVRDAQQRSAPKSFAEIQRDWNEQHPAPKINDMTKPTLPRLSRFDKGPEPFAHPRRGVGD